MSNLDFISFKVQNCLFRNAEFHGLVEPDYIQTRLPGGMSGTSKLAGHWPKGESCLCWMPVPISALKALVGVG